MASLARTCLSIFFELEQFSKLTYTRENSVEELQGLVNQAYAVIHLAGENRSKDISVFDDVNAGLTQSLCRAIRSTGRNTPLVLALAEGTGNSANIYRLSNVFCKWRKPDCNSIFVNKAPAYTVSDLAKALNNLFNLDAPEQVIGYRHDEKLYETLASKEELVTAED
jgi:hypothetical protein